LEAVKVGGGRFIARFGVGESEISVVMAEFSDGLKTWTILGCTFARHDR
jgi:hypothetical protein